MAKGGQKVYMPVVIGDWLKGTRGMRADVRGVYMGLLLHQWEKGFIPSDIYELEEIEREVNKVWDKLKDKFIEIEPGKLQNQKLEEVREFWKKQRKNGGKGGRPKKGNPELNPNSNPEANPNTNHHNDLDLDSDTELKNKKEPVEILEPPLQTSFAIKDQLDSVYDPIYRENLILTFRDIDIDDEWEKFKVKVRGSPEKYRNRDADGIRLAFSYQLRTAPKKYERTPKNSTQQQRTNDLTKGWAERHGNR